MKKIIFLFFVFAVTGQISEIKEQNVPYAGNALQYAIVQMIGQGGPYNIPCPDCTASAKITLGERIIQEGPMIETENGLFSIKLSGDYTIGKTYFMRVNLFSPTYGNGTEDSYILIKPRDAPLSIPKTTTNNILGDDYFGLNETFNKIVSPITGLSSALSDFLSYFGPAGKIIKSVISGFIAVVKFIWPYLKSLLGWMGQNITDFFRDPAGTIIKDITNAWALFMGFIMFSFGGVFIIIELIGLALNVNCKNPMKFLSNMVSYNISAIKLIFGSVWKIGETLATWINALRNVKTGTIGDAV